MEKYNLILFFSVSFAFMAPVILAAGSIEPVSQDELDEPAQVAMRATLEAYNPNPEMVITDFNKQVTQSLSGSNSTRRVLHFGECKAVNPIDKCWRCQPNWAENRQALAKCAIGFAAGTTGGMGGQIYVVTDPSDDNVANPKVGTLRYGVTQKEPLWITFAHSMKIKLQKDLGITSNKTIDGRGATVEITGGAGLSMQHVQNIIIHGIQVHHIEPMNGADGDGIRIYGSSKIWVDHVTLSYGKDGLLDVTMASTAVTVSNCEFTHHDKVMLLGASDGYQEDKHMQVTVAFNRFGTGCVQRMPRCRKGFFHVVNNDYDKWASYAIGGSDEPTIISQGNRYLAPDDKNKKEVTSRGVDEAVWKQWNWRSEGDLFLNGAYFRASGAGVQTYSDQQKQHLIHGQPGSSVGELTRCAGALKCETGKPC